MSESVPYLGSKIRLISMSEIRYEGILYTIDPNESIIALAKVQSFGTEDRPTKKPVPAQDCIYEYIIFRGTDIKNIEVCDTPKQPLTDPAIVGLQVQQQHSAPSVGTSYPGTSFNHHLPLGPIGSVGTYYGNYGQQLGQQNLPSTEFSIGSCQASELSGGIGSSVGGVNVEPETSSSGSQSMSVPTPIGAPQSGISSHSHQQEVLSGSRSSTPGISRKSPVADAGVQVSPPQQQTEKKKQSSPSHQKQHVPESLFFRQHQNRENQGNQSRRNQGGYYQGQNQHQQGSRYNQGYQGQGYYQGQQQQQHYQAQYRGNMGRGRPSRRPSQPRGRGTFNQGNRQKQDQQLFEKEFDFEQANVEFEELLTKLAKTKITENGENEDEKKDDSGHETATTGDESEDSNSTKYYDKSKSFFDSISCEALERSKGKSQRPDWRLERKINVQTFGVASARRGYHPRSRGGYYNRGYYRNYNQGYYRGNMNSGNYRNSRGGGGGGGGGGNCNSAGGGNSRSNNYGEANAAPNAASTSSYASAVRSSVAAK